MREWEGESRVAGFAFLNSLTRQAASAQFEAGEFSAVAGECDVDLGDVTIADGNDRDVIDAFVALRPHDASRAGGMARR